MLFDLAAYLKKKEVDVSTQYYIHDRTRGHVGNCMVWWRRGHHGYTCNVADAHVFTREQALQRIRDADDLSAYTCDSVMAYAEIHTESPLVLNPLVETDEDGK